MTGAHESKLCPDCQADCPAEATRCWMCHADLTGVDHQVVTAELVPTASVSESFFAAATMLLLGIALLIGVGLAVEEPGAAVVYAIVTAPAVLATIVRLQYRKYRVGHVSWAERFVTLILSATVVIGMLGLLIVASIAALFVYCLTAGPISIH